MYGYGMGTSMTTRELIDQMAMEMEKKAKECEALRRELAKKDSLLKEAEQNTAVLRQECREARSGLAAAQEEKSRIAQILGLDCQGASGAHFAAECTDEPAYRSGVADPAGRHAASEPAERQAATDSRNVEDPGLTDYASAVLERMRELNRTLPTV